MPRFRQGSQRLIQEVSHSLQNLQTFHEHPLEAVKPACTRAEKTSGAFFCSFFMQFISQLEQQLRKPLPGRSVQAEMSVIPTENNHFTPRSGARNAGVLSLFFPKNSVWHLALIRRAFHEKDHHSRQISFPGGSYEERDGSFEKTALRETEEEINVHQSKVQIIGKLTEIYIPVSNFNVHPYVGFMDEYPDFKPQQGEVDAVLEIPVDVLIDDGNRLKMPIETRGYKIPDVPVFQFDEDVVWGATAMMLNELIAIIKPSMPIPSMLV